MTCLVKRDLYLAAVFLWSMPLLTALSITAIVGVSCSVLVALSLSVWVALAALIFLIGIHKLEYFLNAHIVGTRIRARAWEILLAMLVMEAAFGLPGVVAAAIYYAYLKRELKAAELL